MQTIKNIQQILESSNSDYSQLHRMVDLILGDDAEYLVDRNEEGKMIITFNHGDAEHGDYEIEVVLNNQSEPVALYYDGPDGSYEFTDIHEISRVLRADDRFSKFMYKIRTIVY